MDLLLLGGIMVFNLTLIWLFYFKKGFAENYVRTSPKAYIWKKMFGEKKALWLLKYIFAPIGIIFSGAIAILLVLNLAL